MADDLVVCQSIDQARAYCASNLRAMVQHGASLRGHTAPEFHYVTADWLMGVPPFSTNRVKCWLGFRFAAKSWELRQFLKTRWLRCPWMQVILHSSSDRNAKKFTKAIKDELTYDPLTTHLRPEKSASEYEFNLRGIQHEHGTSITAAGIKTSMTSLRCDLYLFDDPEPDNEPEALRERIIQAFGEANDILHSPRRHFTKMGLEKDAEVPRPERIQMVVVGQPHHEETAYVPMEDDLSDDGDGHPLRDADYLIVDVLNSKGEFLWPEMMAEKYFHYDKGRPKTVDEVRRGMTTSRWQLQYRINWKYAQQAGPVLKLDQVELVHKRVPWPILVIDPADSESGCEWGIVCGGMIGDKIHILQMTGLQGEAYEGDDWYTLGESVWADAFDVWREFRCARVYIEKNLKAAATACRRYMEKTGISAVVEEYHNQQRKEKRIPEALEQPFNNGIVTMEPHVVADPQNRRQLAKLRWRKLPSPNDRIDALSALLRILIEEPMLYAGNARQSWQFPNATPVDSRPVGFDRMGQSEARNGFSRLER